MPASTSALQVILSKNQSKRENDLTYYINDNYSLPYK